MCVCSSFKLFLELEPQLREIVYKLHDSKYAYSLKLLDEMKVCAPCSISDWCVSIDNCVYVLCIINQLLTVFHSLDYKLIVQCFEMLLVGRQKGTSSL